MAIGKPKKVCSTCKSENVIVDGEAKWNAALALWVMDSIRHAWCNVCDRKTDIITTIPHHVD